ncbi:MAG: magnesium transporter [Bacteroidota bacterium]
METKEIQKELLDHFFKNYPTDVSVVLNTCSTAEILTYLKEQPLLVARDVLLRLERNTAANVLSKMDDDFFATLFPTIDPYKGALLLSQFSKNSLPEKLENLPGGLAKELKELLSYPAESAGFLMDTKILSFHPSSTVKEVLKKLRTLNDRTLANVYVTDEAGYLLGRVPVQKIAISGPREKLNNLIVAAVSVHAMSPQQEVVDLLRDGKLFSLPVVDLENRLLGIIRNDALIKAATEDATEDVQALFGAGRDERALSKVSFAVKKRLPWLQINLVTAFLAASVVGAFEDTIAKITVLAVFLPVVAGQSGNTGSQALAVTMRGLALREIRPTQWFRVARKEAAVGFINGVAVALTTAIIVYFWATSFGLAVVIGVSMVFSMVIAGFSGAVIPIFLKSIGQDPAQSSSIVLTTVTDIVGFLSFLGLATALGAALGII